MMLKAPAPPTRVKMLLVAITLMLALVVATLPTAAHAAPEQAPTESAASGGVYKVKRGDTLGEIARYFGVTVRDIMVANGLSSSTIYVGQRLHIPAGGSPSKAGCTNVYRVQRGDTLTKIAKRYNMNVSALARANGISNASHIVVGQVICIPQIWGDRSSSGHGSSGGSSHGVHVVRPGDTLSQIAKSYGTSMRSLMEINNIKNPNQIYVGQRIQIR
jgi:LysM repeat protein